MENVVKNWYAMSDPAILEVLGNFIKQTRLQQNKTDAYTPAPHPSSGHSRDHLGHGGTTGGQGDIAS